MIRHAATGNAAHESYVSGGGSAACESSRSFDEVGTGLYCELCAAQFFFHGEQRGFEDDLEDCAVMMRDRSSGMHGVLDRMVVAALKLANGDDHVELFGAEARKCGSLLP